VGGQRTIAGPREIVRGLSCASGKKGQAATAGVDLASYINRRHKLPMQYDRSSRQTEPLMTLPSPFYEATL
jgi:hypothetical protein